MNHKLQRILVWARHCRDRSPAWLVCLLASLPWFFDSQEIESAGDGGLNEAISWMPTNIETLVVSKQPFTEQGEKLSLDFLPFHVLANTGADFKVLAEHGVKYGLLGSRNHRAPKKFGSMKCDSGQVIRLEKPLSATDKERLLAGVLKNMARTETILEHEVWIVEKKLEADEWKFYCAIPTPSLLVTATDRGSMKTILARMRLETFEKRALADFLPNWRKEQEDTAFWCIRRFDKEFALTDPSNPFYDPATSPFGKRKPYAVADQQAIGITISYDRSRVENIDVRYHTANPEVESLSRDLWTNVGGKVEFERLPPNSVRFQFSRDCILEGAFVLMMEGFLGHGILM